VTTNQEARQISCRAASGTAFTVNEDWMAVAATAGFTTGTINERLLNYLNAALGATWDVASWDETSWDGTGGDHTNINEAQAAFAESNGVAGIGGMFSQLGSF
tara:strand:- start:94 stop:402 length:309 start_codon:yes stop_codon:yes gene_type:complete